MKMPCHVNHHLVGHNNAPFFVMIHGYNHGLTGRDCNGIHKTHLIATSNFRLH